MFTCNALNALRLRLEELRKADPETFHLAAHRLLPCRITASTGALPTSCADTTAHGNIFDIAYDFNLGKGDNGNVLNITNYKDASRNQSFGYDSVNRLTSAQNAGSDCSLPTVNGKTKYWGNSYTYDEWGNLNQKTVTKCGAEYLNVAPLTNNQLTGYGYDAAGNMTSDPTDSVTSTYDQENRISVATKNGVATTYVYDAGGDRVQKSNSASGTLYWYMTPGIVGESDLNGNLQSEYVFFDGERVARRDLPSGSVAYYFSDYLKTASVITDSLGNIKAESDYYPWGGELQFVNNDSNHYKFTGKERDTETQLDYFGARYYSNGLGRFITPDWAAKAAAVPYAEFADPQSLNLYTYVRNTPATLFDIDGHCIPFCDVMGSVMNFVASHPQVAAKAGAAVSAVQKTVAAHPRTMQALKGAGKIVTGGATVAVSATAEVGSGGLATVPVIFGVMGGTATFVSGVTDIMGAATNTNVKEADKALSAVSNPAGLVTTAVTGDIEKGSQASAIGDLAVTSGDPADLLKGSTTDQLVKTGLAAQSLIEGVTAVKELVPPPKEDNK